MATTKNDLAKKVEKTVYMTEKEGTFLNELFIKRLKGRKKTDRSALFCEGIRLLVEKEIGGGSNA